MTPVGIFFRAFDEFVLYGVRSKVTSDCLVDRLVGWWETVKERFSHIKTFVINLLLCSLNAVTKESTTMTRRFRRSTPHPRLGPVVQLECGDAGSSLNFFGISKGLTS